MQHLTAILLPSSAENVMSHEEDRCVQCQQLGHIACHCPNVHCFECKEYGHIVVACPHWIPPSGTPVHCHRQDSNTRHHTRSTSRHHHWDRYRHSRSGSQSQPHRYQSHSHYDPHRGCSRSHHRDSNATIGVLHDTIFTMTHHIKGHPHIGVLQLTQKTTADHDHTLNISQVRKFSTSLHPILAELQ